MIKIKTLSRDDIKFALDITEKEGWEYDKDDFERMLFYEPRGTFIAVEDEKECGLITTINYGKIGWIGNVVVALDYRDQGIGEKLVTHAVGYLKSAGVRSVKLCAYLDTREFYSHMGFEVDGYCCVYSYSKSLKKDQITNENIKPIIRKMNHDDIPNVSSLDRNIFGFDRARLLKKMFEEFPNQSFLSDIPQSEGYIMGSDSAETAEIGPWVCSPDIEKESAVGLLLACLSDVKAHSVNIVVPEENELAVEILKDIGFKNEYRVAIMHFGESIDFAEPQGIFALYSLAQG